MPNMMMMMMMMMMMIQVTAGGTLQDTTWVAIEYYYSDRLMGISGSFSAAYRMGGCPSSTSSLLDIN
jgi:hypothetical protein